MKSGEKGVKTRQINIPREECFNKTAQKLRNVSSSK